MSVLLEALKKAAEEKKNSAKDNSAAIEATDTSVAEETPQKSSSAPEESFQFQLEPAANTKTSQVQEPIDFDKLDAETSGEPVFTDSKDTESDDAVVEQQAEQDSPFNEVADHEIDQSDNAESDDVKVTDKKDEASDYDELPEENEYDQLMETLEEDDSFSQSLTLLGEAEFRQTNSSMLQLASEDTTVPVKPEDIEIDDIELDGGYVEDVPELEDNSTQLTSSKNSLNDESFDWSMDSLPGYVKSDSVDVKAKQQNTDTAVNPILLGTANRPPAAAVKSKYQSTSIIFLGAFIVLLMILIGVYGINYYLEESENLERSMKKYDLVGLNIKPKQIPQQQNSQAGQIVEERQNTADEEVLVIVPTKESLSSKEVSAQNTAEADAVPEVSSSSSTNNGVNVQSNSAKVANKKPDVYTPNTTPSSAAVATKNKVVKKATSTNKPVSKSSAIASLPVVTINKTKSGLADGYEAYNAGDFNNASAHFSRVIQSEPQNINALMGMGAIAVVNQDYAVAVQYYEQVLDKEPNNLSALEAIANLSGLVPLNDEWNKQLFIMADIHTQSAILQNAVGNTFAKRKDWLAAQESYFKAYANSPNNPDYMVNLAVSYDHLGEYALAAQYYTLALGHAAHTRVSFDEHQVKSRLISIKQLMLKGR